MEGISAIRFWLANFCSCHSSLASFFKRSTL